MIARFAPALLLFAALTPAARAQDATGNVEGVVLTVAGSPLAAVTVTARGPNLQGSRHSATDDRGYFRLLALPIGEYTVALTRLEYRAVTFTDVAVRLGHTTALGEARLDQQAIELNGIVVTAERPLIDPSTAATGMNLSSETFTTLPMDRNFRSIAPLAPQTDVSGLQGDEANIAGSTGPENAYFVDGINITDPHLALTSTNLPYNFVREIEVKTGGYEAEYGRAMGGIINVITQSGSNNFHGQVFGSFTNAALTGEPRFAVPGEFQTAFSQYDVGGSLGGPIARDRLWFFVAYDPSFSREAVVIPGVTLPDASQTSHLFAGKLTWRPGQRTSVLVTALGDPAPYRNVTPVGVDSVLTPEAVFAVGHQGGFVLSAEARQQLGQQAQLTLSLARFSGGRSITPGSDLGRTEPSFYDLQNNFLAGGLGEVSRESTVRAAIRASVTASLGLHAVKAGAEYEDNTLDEDINSSGTDGGGAGSITRYDDTTYRWIKQRVGAKLHNRVSTVYVQDSWRLSRRARLNFGVRWDGEYLTGPDGTVAQSFADQWQPRLGFIYAPGELGSQKVFGSFGRFYEQIPLKVSSYYYNGSGIVVIGYNHDPRVDPSGADTLFNLSRMYSPQVEARQDLRGESFVEFTLGYERAVTQQFRIGVRGIYRTLRWALEDAFDTTSGAYHIGNPGRGALAFAPRATRKYLALVLTFEKPRGRRLNFGASYVLSRVYGNYEGLYDFEQSVALPNAGSQFDFPEQYPNSTGLLSNDRTHVVKFYGTWRCDFGLTAGVFVNWQSGTPRNEFGAASIGYPVYRFLVTRGSAGRTPALLDGNLRLSQALPARPGAWLKPRIQLDLLHVGSPRSVLRYDDVRYTFIDASGNQAGPNPNYGRGAEFQAPMSVLLGLVVDF